ncbi:MAG: YbjQ family protein [Phycisphaerales bacterium]|nr:YbjQ family protein [Phycisphaerales bacterium]
MSIPVTTTFTIDGYRIREYKGVVRGITVRAPTISQGIFGGLKSIIGGRIEAYTQMCEQARQQAFELLIDHARALGANAIVGLRYDASDVGGTGRATEVLCYGTAVVIEAT